MGITQGCFEQILEAAPNKTAAVGPLASHLTNHTRKTIKKCWALIENQGQTRKQCSPGESHLWTH